MILEAGLNDIYVTWGKVQPEIARTTRVCSYDRAGLGWSQQSPSPHTSEVMVEEHHTLLRNTGIERPYILVGHSFGGIVVRNFARQYPDQVVGMVLVDSAHEEQVSRLPFLKNSADELVAQFRTLSLLSSSGLMALSPGAIPNRGFPEGAYRQYQAVLFIEYGMGLRSVTLGHAFSEVVEAAYRQMQLGSNFGRIAPVELECATQLLGMVPRADMVKFAKDGSTVTTAALKLARAYTGRKLIAICADHPFFSFDDWFIGTTGIDAGVDSAAVAHTLRFRYNDADSLTQLFTTYPEQIACVMLEAARIEEPRPDFLPAIRRLCDEHGALLVLDEMVTGFRWSNGGAQAVYDIEPDLSCFVKALGNGFAISALAGKRRVMELGGFPVRAASGLSEVRPSKIHLGARTATIKKLDALPYVQSEYTQLFRFDTFTNPKLKELRPALQAR